MNLNQYINRHPRTARRLVRERIAERAGVKEPVIRHYANGTRPVPAKHAIPIAEATGFAVLPHDLCATIYPNPTDGLPPSVRQSAATTGSEHAGDMTAQRGQAGVRAGGGHATTEHGVELRQHGVSDGGRLNGDRIEQYEHAGLQRERGISKKNDSMLGGSAFGHGGQASVSVSGQPLSQERPATARRESCVALIEGGEACR